VALESCEVYETQPDAVISGLHNVHSTPSLIQIQGYQTDQMTRG